MAAPDRMRQGGAECDGPENQRWPPWLKPLLGTSFFGPCKLHADAHKSECNMYCLDCMNGALCSQCLAYHRDHHAIQVSLHSLPSDWTKTGAGTGAGAGSFLSLSASKAFQCASSIQSRLSLGLSLLRFGAC
jgi:hypothetical protein